MRRLKNGLRGGGGEGKGKGVRPSPAGAVLICVYIQPIRSSICRGIVQFQTLSSRHVLLCDFLSQCILLIVVVIEFCDQPDVARMVVDKYSVPVLGSEHQVEDLNSAYSQSWCEIITHYKLC